MNLARRIIQISGKNMLVRSAYTFTEQVQLSELVNPYTKQSISKREYLKEDALMTKLSMASVSYRKWKQVSLQMRVGFVKRFVESIVNDKETLKPIIASQIGKSYRDIDEEFRRIEVFAGKLIQSGRNSLKSQIVQKQSFKIKKVSYEPLGLSLIFPFSSQPIFDSLINLIPCLISGNGALIKSSDYNHFLGPYLQRKSKEIFGRSALIADIFIEPKHLPFLAQFRTIKKVIYSGSPDSAKSIFETLIKQRFIDCNLFFGGKDAAYVDQTADLQHAARQIVHNSFYNNGQSYDCIKRLYTHKDIAAQLIELLVSKIAKITYGNPESDVNLGPLFVPQNASLAQSYINQCISEGASCQIGGLSATDGEKDGIFFEPTLLNNCTNDMPIVQSQLSAPILCVIPLGSQSVFNEINQNDFGVGLRIFTKDHDRYKEAIEQFELGKISFNSGSLFDSNLPIEGWKRSGKGKILSELSFQQFSIPKSYNIKQL